MNEQATERKGVSEKNEYVQKENSNKNVQI